MPADTDDFDLVDARLLVATGDELLISAERLRRARNLIERSGICEQLDRWRTSDASDRNRGGRPAAIPDLAILTVFLLLAAQGQPLHVRLASDLIARGMTDDTRQALGITQHPADSDDWYDRTWRAFHRLLDVIDPYPGPRRNVSDADHAANLTARVEANSGAKQERPDWVANQLLDMS